MEYEIGPEESVSTAVVRAVSAVEGQDPPSLRPLSTILNPDALDALFIPQQNGSPRIGGRISFVYRNCQITVDNGEYLTLQPLEPLRTRRASETSEQSYRVGDDAGGN
jgi:hypothetical protein